MNVPVILDELNACETFDEFLENIEQVEGVNVKMGKVSGMRCALLTRPVPSNPSSAIQDECTITVIAEDFTMPGKAINKIYDFNDRYCNLTLPNNKPTFVEEKLSGIPILLSRHESTYILSTKKSLHGSDVLPGPRPVTAASFLVEEINNALPNKGLDAFYDKAWVSDMAWQFQITQNKFLENELVLVAATNMDSGEELSIGQMDNIAEYFRLKRPKRVTVYGREHLFDGIQELLKENPTLDEVILRDRQGERAFFAVPNELKFKTCVRGSRREILMMAGCVLRGVQLLDFEATSLVKLFEENLSRLAAEAKTLYELNAKRRTRKRFAEGVTHHPFSKAIFALRDNKIDSIENLSEVITPVEFVKLVGRVDGNRLHEEITKYKETICQQQK